MTNLLKRMKSLRWVSLGLAAVLLAACGLLPAAPKPTAVPVATQPVSIVPAKLVATDTKAAPANTATKAPTATTASSKPAPTATTAPTSESAAQFGILGDITDHVTVKASAKAQEKPGTFGESLPKGAVLTTDDTGRARILLENGSTVRMAPNTQLSLVDRQEPKTETDNVLTQLNLLVGKVWAILGKGADESLEIETPIGTGAVRGSYMSIEYIPGASDDPTDDVLIITCLEGNCSLTTPLGTINLTTGQKVIIIGKGNPPTGPTPMTQEDVQDWLDNNVEILILFGIGNGQTGGPIALGPITLQLPGGGTIVVVIPAATDTPTPTPTATSTGGGGSTLPTTTPSGGFVWPNNLGVRADGLAVVGFGLVFSVAGAWYKRRK